ncbi:hypothetical protein ACQZQZ_07630 [Aeromonas salmonicida subsp. pectinolytica]
MLFLSIFFASLANHSGATIYIALIISLFKLFLTFQFSNVRNIHASPYVISLIFILISAVFFVLGIPSYQPAQEFIDAFPLNLIKYLLLVTLMISYSILYSKDKERFIRSVNFVLNAHVLFFFIQFFCAYALGEYIDYVLPFTGEASRYKIYGVDAADGFYRCTGFYIEPSTYAVSIFVLSSILMSHSFSQYKKSIVVATISVLASFSTISFLIVLLYWGLFFARKFLKPKIMPIFIIVIPAAFLFISQTNFYQMQIEKASNTSGIRFALLDAIVERPTSLLVMGSGLYAIERSITDGSKGHCAEGMDCSAQINRLYASPSDSGLLVYMFIKFGILTIPILFYVVRPFISDYHKLSSFIVILFTKIQFAFPLLWILIVIYRDKNEENNSNNELAAQRRCRKKHDKDC